MTLEEIRKNAPEGATHYKECGDSIAYYKVTRKHSFFWNCDYWAASYRDLLSFSQPLY